MHKSGGTHELLAIFKHCFFNAISFNAFFVAADGEGILYYGNILLWA